MHEPCSLLSIQPMTSKIDSKLANGVRSMGIGGAVDESKAILCQCLCATM